MYTFVSFTVVELFEKVWQIPMVKLAHDIDVSDVAVAKACRKAGIPLPGRGHWAKSEKQRQRKPKPPQVEGNVRLQVLDHDNSLAKTGTDFNSPILRRTIEAPPSINGASRAGESMAKERENVEGRRWPRMGPVYSFAQSIPFKCSDRRNYQVAFGKWRREHCS
ncbi:hypothetical protein [Pseudomonas sp. CYM-20-01]|uniref:hypothetical protein n=1 Tax=Pseudomonas sp. CYM-20-01 TaxID=2870750 RepID=UPI0020BD606B|nr:hypothetical protein [Pseudomonas sp. CYM-20-01]